jgi:NAD-dependent dihydropyrimidine dehydrogenase PreA subunit
LKNFAQKKYETRIFKREHTKTAFVALDTKKCEACWKCMEVCANGVIGRVNLPWHKHSLFINGSECIGCMKCLRICKVGAISKLITE